jgi:membrane protein YdbS with pleckstrin-like domain
MHGIYIRKYSTPLSTPLDLSYINKVYTSGSSLALQLIPSSAADSIRHKLTNYYLPIKLLSKIEGTD